GSAVPLNVNALLGVVAPSPVWAPGEILVIVSGIAAGAGGDDWARSVAAQQRIIAARQHAPVRVEEELNSMAARADTPPRERFTGCFPQRAVGADPPHFGALKNAEVLLEFAHER